MRLRLFDLLSMVSLFLLIGTVILCIRSYWTADYVAYCLESKEHGVISTVGRVVLYDESAIAPFRWKAPFGFQYAARPAPPSMAAYDLPNSRRHGRWLGFGVMSGDNGRYSASVRFVPYWSVAIVMAILPVLWLRKRWRIGNAFCRSDRGFAVSENSSAIKTEA
jgi:hypothetical protein